MVLLVYLSERVAGEFAGDQGGPRAKRIPIASFRAKAIVGGQDRQVFPADAARWACSHPVPKLRAFVDFLVRELPFRRAGASP